MKLRRDILTFAVGIAIVSSAACFLVKRSPAVDTSHQTIIVGGVERVFRVTVPDRLLRPAPVVFAFHGMGDSAESMAAYSRLDRVAADNGFLLIYPAGRKAQWTVSGRDPATRGQNPDIQFFDALLTQVDSQYDIDLDRVYLMGMSNGSSFVQILAHARSSSIAAVVAHSGPRPRLLNDSEFPFPVLMIVGSDDFCVGSMQSNLVDYRAAGHEAEIIVVEGLGHAWSLHSNDAAWSFLVSHTLPH